MAEAKQKLRKTDKTNFALPPLSWEAWECFWDGEHFCLPILPALMQDYRPLPSGLADLWQRRSLQKLWGKS